MNLGIENKVVLVTGAAKGMGSAIARAFIAEGAKVLLVDIDEPLGRALANELGPRAAFFPGNITRGRDAAAAVDECVARFGGLHFLINNAGVQTYGTVTDTTEELWDQTIAVNLKGAFLCAHYALPQIIKTGEGVVINIASVQALISQQNVAAYTTSKTALLGLTRSIAIDYAPRVRCVAICPGTIDTPMFQAAVRQSPDPATILEECQVMHPLKRIGESAEVADLTLFLCSDRARFITGHYYRIDGGLGIGIGGSKRS